MSQLKDLNIVRVLGVCTQEEPLCMVVEYMKYGDLNQFLIDHEPEGPVAEAANLKTLRYSPFIPMIDDFLFHQFLFDNGDSNNIW